MIIQVQNGEIIDLKKVRWLAFSVVFLICV